MKSMNKVSCIIPAFNEAGRIAQVLDAIIEHPLIDEIIVVDDKSTDQTKEVVRKYSTITLVEHGTNQGKSAAVYSGLIRASGNIIFLLDADLQGLTAHDITLLIEPVLKNTKVVSMSMRKNSPWIDRVIGIDYLSGERVFSKTLLGDSLDLDIEKIRHLRGFELEVFLNRIIIAHQRPVQVIFWKNVVSPFKYKTYWGLQIRSDIYMTATILQYLSIAEVLAQFFNLRRLMVK